MRGTIINGRLRGVRQSADRHCDHISCAVAPMHLNAGIRPGVSVPGSGPGCGSEADHLRWVRAVDYVRGTVGFAVSCLVRCRVAERVKWKRAQVTQASADAYAQYVTDASWAASRIVRSSAAAAAAVRMAAGTAPESMSFARRRPSRSSTPRQSRFHNGKCRSRQLSRHTSGSQD